MFIMANLVRKIESQQSQFEEMSVELPKFYLFAMSQLRVLRVICFKAREVPLE